MQVFVKKSVLEQLINQIVENRGYHSRRIDQVAGDEKPVLPDAQMATQLSHGGEPIGDPDFLPVNKQQLSTAASQMAQQVAPDKIQKFYSGLKKLVRKTGEKKQYRGMSQTDLMENLEIIIKKLIKESDDDEKDDADIAAAGFSAPPPSMPKRRTQDVSDTSDLDKQDLVKALLSKMSGGAERSIAASTAEQERRIRIATGKARPEDILPSSEPLKGEPTVDNPGSVFAINPRPPAEPATLDDATKGDVYRLITYLHKNNMEIPSSYSKIKDLYPDFKIEFEVAKPEIKNLKEGYLKVVFILNGKRVNFGTERKPIDGRVYFLVGKDGDELPFKRPPYIDSFSKTYQEAYELFQKDQGVEEEIPKFDVEEEEEKAPTPGQIFYSGLEDYSKESGIPVGTLRNLASDLSTIFSDYSVIKLKVDTFDYIYESLFVKRAKELGVSAYFPSDYTTFTEQKFVIKDDTIREDIVEIIDSFIKSYLKSENFKNDFPEYHLFRQYVKGGMQLKTEEFEPSRFAILDQDADGKEELSQTEKRLGIRDINSLDRFCFGFALTGAELSLEVLEYLSAKAKITDFSTVPFLSSNFMGGSLRKKVEEAKKLFGDDLASALSEIKQLPHFARYFVGIEEPTDLLSSFDDPLKTFSQVKANKTKIDALITKVDESAKNTP